MRNYMAIATIVVLTAIHFAFGQPDYLMGDNLLKVFTYSFFHANVFHLAINSWSLYLIYKNRRLSLFAKEMPLAYLVSIVVYPLSIKPIIGISNILYAVIGMRTPSFGNNWWKSQNTIVFLIVTLLMAFIPSISATTHIASFAIGVLIACIGRKFKEIGRDVERSIR